MKNVPTPISVMVTRKVYLRPIMSPSRPKISAPNGRTAKPAANASSVKMNPTFAGTLEKKYFAKERAERAVDVKVVPLEHGAERRGEDHEPLFAGHAPRARCVDRHRRHGRSPRVVHILAAEALVSCQSTCAGQSQAAWPMSVVGRRDRCLSARGRKPKVESRTCKDRRLPRCTRAGPDRGGGGRGRSLINVNARRRLWITLANSGAFRC